jgi:RNA polymerase sigma-70 factor, ECF subfamily
MQQQIENIIHGCMNGEAAAQQRLYRHCFDQMFKVCLRYNNNEQDAANCYNEAMYTVLSKISQYKQEGEFMGWVRRIMVNTCLNAIKRNQKFVYKEVGEQVSESLHVQPEVYSQFKTRQILEMVQALPRQTALVFNLYVMEGYTHDQVGDMLGISPNTSKWHLNNARTLLKEQMNNITVNENYQNA